jgi:hypothetical protein
MPVEHARYERGIPPLATRIAGLQSSGLFRSADERVRSDDRR